MNRLCLLHFLLSTGLAAAAPPSERLVTLKVQPAAAPVPALKYQLLPEVAELNSGNAVPAYFKCFTEQTGFFSIESVQEREKILNGPLTEIKPGSLKNYGDDALRQADYAARLEYADWNILPQVREHGYTLRLPEVQALRNLAAALAVRCRGQMVDNDYDGAIQTLQTIFALARHMGDCPSIITGQVGTAVALVGLNQIEELIQQPEAPNLYWALTGLPAQLVDVRKGVSTNRGITRATFGSLLDPKRIWNRQDIEAAYQKMKRTGAMTDGAEEDRKSIVAWIRERLRDEAWLAAARNGLAESGYPADAVDKYPPEQVLLFHIYRKSRIHYDEAFKWMPVPYWQSAGPLAEMQKPPADVEERLTKMMPFAVAKIKSTHVRLEQRIGLLRAVEAIRLDSAHNGGKAPASLNDLTVPVPPDPVSGKPFDYKLDGNTITLEGKPIPVPGGGTTQQKYEVRLRK